MNNLIFSLNATIPIFLTMMLGILIKRIMKAEDSFFNTINQFVFKIALPCLLFEDLATTDFKAAWDTKFVIFCFVVTLLCITISFVISNFFIKKELQGEFIQGSYRSSAAILGIAFITNIYGNSGMAPLMILASVPLYNMMAVIVLSIFKKERVKISREVIIKTTINILKNPIIIGIVVGCVYSFLALPLPNIAQKTIHNVAVLATPLGLMSMGASFDIKKAFGHKKEAIIACFMKLVGFALIFVPIAIMCGFTHDKLIAILVMLGSATTVSSYIMAKNMGHDGVLSSAIVMLTTLLSAFSLTTWLFVLKSLQFI